MNKIEIAVRARSTEQLKEDARVAMNTNERGSAVAFVTILNVLEDRLPADQYEAFEESLVGGQIVEL